MACQPAYRQPCAMRRGLSRQQGGHYRRLSAAKYPLNIGAMPENPRASSQKDARITSQPTSSRGISHTTARRVFLFFAGATVVASPWMLGSASVLAQKFLLIGALGTLVSGILVRSTTRLTPGTKAAWRVQRLVLAAGLLFLGFLFWQAMNPSHEALISGNSWQLVELGHASGVPSSIAAPFDSIPGDFLPYKNAWRYLLVFSVAWIYAAGLGVGFVDRDDAKRWAALVGLNAAALAVVCIAHRAMGEELTLWKFSDTVAFTGSPVFFYKNHNGAYLAASLAVALGLAATAKETGPRRGWQAVALALWVATLAVNSRVATGCATLWIVVYGIWLWRNASAGRGKEPQKNSPVAALVAAAAVVILVGLTGGGKLLGRFSHALQAPGDFLQGGHYRVLLREVGCEMWFDRPIFGWGGGAYLYLFNGHQSRVPEVVEQMYREQPNLNRLYMVSADCDWVEFLAEYGAFGVSLLLFAAGALAFATWRWDGWKQGLPFFLTLGGVGLALHAWYDHVLRNEALLVLFLSLLMVGARLAAPRESSRASSRSGKREKLSASTSP